MTIAVSAGEMTRRSPGLGPIGEFLVTGGSTLLLFPVLWLLRLLLGFDWAELVVGFLTFHAAFVINDPHFAVTYLLFYRRLRERLWGTPGAQRWRYWAAGVVAPLVLLAWCGYALIKDSPNAMGLLLQLMFFLVGWHYVKQGFGLLSVLSLRRGVRYTPLERKLMLGHCLAGWLYARASPPDPGRVVEEKGVVFMTLPHPPGLEGATGVAFAASSLLLAWVLWTKWRRDGQLPPLPPLLGFLITVWLWVVWSDASLLMVYLIPALHSLQYLYFVWLLEGNQARATEGPPRFGRPYAVRLGVTAVLALALGWLLFRGLPEFLDEALRLGVSQNISALGATPYLAALFAFVNLHHYFMDAVIWRRENPETRYLLSADPQAGH